MALSKHKLGEFIESISIKCGIAKCNDVKGINIKKEFFPSRNVGEDTSKYLIVPPKAFAMNLMHIGRDERIPIAINNTQENIIVSPAYEVFKIIENDAILLEYFNILVRLSEFDRYTWFCTDSSIRGNLDWESFCDIDIELPAIDIQQKYVDIYNSMKANQEAYEKGLDDLKLTCDAYIENVHKTNTPISIRTYIRNIKNKNSELVYNLDCVKGISISKKFIDTKANMTDVSLKPYYIVKPNMFAYVSVTSRNGNKISIAHNTSCDTYIVSPSYIVFEVSKQSELNAYFLMMFLSRIEFDRYARYHSWGSTREVFSWDDLCDVKIPIPSIDIQESIVNIYNAYNERKTLNEKLKQQIKDICPILIKGSLEEGKR